MIAAIYARTIIVMLCCLLAVATHSASAQTDECGRMRNARREGENQMMALLASPLMTPAEQLAAGRASLPVRPILEQCARAMREDRRVRGEKGMTADQLYPRITATGPSVKRGMVWQDLLACGETGATPRELATRLIKDGKAMGSVEGCAALLKPLLDELAGMVGERQTMREGERFTTRRLPKEA